MRRTFAWGMAHGAVLCKRMFRHQHCNTPCSMPFAPCNATLHCAQYERTPLSNPFPRIRLQRFLQDLHRTLHRCAVEYEGNTHFILTQTGRGVESVGRG